MHVTALLTCLACARTLLPRLERSQLALQLFSWLCTQYSKGFLVSFPDGSVCEHGGAQKNLWIAVVITAAGRREAAGRTKKLHGCT